MSAPAISGLLGPRIKVPWAVPRTHVTRFAINASSKETLQQMECLGMIYSLWRACWRLMMMMMMMMMMPKTATYYEMSSKSVTTTAMTMTTATSTSTPTHRK